MNRYLGGLIGLSLLAIGAIATLAWQFLQVPRSAPEVQLASVQTGAITKSIAAARAALVRSCQSVELTSDREARVSNVPVNQGGRVARDAVIVQLDGKPVDDRYAAGQWHANAQPDLDSACIPDENFGPRSIDALRRRRVAEAADTIRQPLRHGHSENADCGEAHKLAQLPGINSYDHAALGGPLIIRAPYDGYVTELAVHGGEEVVSGSVLARIADARCLFVRVKAPVLSDVEHHGAIQACLSFPAVPGPPDCIAHPVQMTEISGGRGQSHIELNELPPSVGPGSDVQVRFLLTAAPDAMRIPRQALLEDGQSVWQFDEQRGTVNRRALTLGLRGDEYVEVLSGIAPGQRFVIPVSGTRPELRDGDRVRVLAPASNANNAVAD